MSMVFRNNFSKKNAKSNNIIKFIGKTMREKIMIVDHAMMQNMKTQNYLLAKKTKNAESVVMAVIEVSFKKLMNICTFVNDVRLKTQNKKATN